MDSDLYHHYHHHQRQPQQIGLTRYQSAPSSYFSDFINSSLVGDDNNDQFFNPKVSTTDQILMKITSSFAAAAAGTGGDSISHNTINQTAGFEPQFMDCVKQEQETIYSESQQQQQQQQQMIYQNQFQSHSQTDHNNQAVSTCSSTIDDTLTTMNLPRQNSSPAGFFDHLDIEHGTLYLIIQSLNIFIDIYIFHLSIYNTVNTQF